MSARFSNTLGAVVVLSAASACAHVDHNASDGATVADAASPQPGRPAIREHQSVTGVSVGAPPIKSAKPTDLMTAMTTDLAQRLGVSASAVQVFAIEPTVWNDSSLGCPQPGQAYLPAQTPGLRVLLKHADKTYQYHATEGGRFVLCANPARAVGEPDKE